MGEAQIRGTFTFKTLKGVRDQPCSPGSRPSMHGALTSSSESRQEVDRGDRWRARRDRRSRDLAEVLQGFAQDHQPEGQRTGLSSDRLTRV